MLQGFCGAHIQVLCLPAYLAPHIYSYSCIYIYIHISVCIISISLAFQNFPIRAPELTQQAKQFFLIRRQSKLRSF